MAQELASYNLQSKGITNKNNFNAEYVLVVFFLPR